MGAPEGGGTAMGLSARITGGGVKALIVPGSACIVPPAAITRVGQPTQPAMVQDCKAWAPSRRSAAPRPPGWLVRPARGLQ